MDQLKSPPTSGKCLKLSTNYDTSNASQVSKPSLQNKLAVLFNNEHMADVHFIVGKEVAKKIPAHRFVLSLNSPVFNAMFNGPKSSSIDEIELPDFEPEAFLAFLRFMYTDELFIDPKSAVSLLLLSEKYRVLQLEQPCIDFLLDSVDIHNVFTVLSQAKRLNASILIDRCFKLIDEDPSAFENEDVLCVDLDTLCCVLERENPFIREITVFNVTLRWAEAECTRRNLPPTGLNKRKVLGRALFLVRFPLMTAKEFAKEVSKTGVLNPGETVAIFRHLALPSDKSLRGFVDTPRGKGAELRIKMFHTLRRAQPIESHTTHNSIRFVANRAFLIKGFEVYGPLNNEASCGIVLSLDEAETEKQLGCCISVITPSSRANTSSVLFEEPVKVKADKEYSVQVVRTVAQRDVPLISSFVKEGQRISRRCPLWDGLNVEVWTPSEHSTHGLIAEMILYKC